MDYKAIYDKMSDDQKQDIADLYAEAWVLVDMLDWLVDNRPVDPRGSKATDKWIKTVNALLEDLEYQMQEVWGFERNANYHTWWLKPKHCKCPKMDNTDPCYYGRGKIITEDCPLHGHWNKEKK